MSIEDKSDLPVDPTAESDPAQNGDLLSEILDSQEVLTAEPLREFATASQVVAMNVPCFACHEPSFAKCFICNRPYCKKHPSYSDIALCFDCGSGNPAAEQDALRANFEMKPLVDDEGVEHDGKHLVPVADTFVVRGYIDRLTDEELDEQVNEYAVKMKDAEKLYYSRMIVHTTLRGAQDERKRRKRIKDRGAVVAKEADGSKVLIIPSLTATGKTTSTRKSTTAGSGVSEALKGMAASMTPEQKKAFMTKIMDIIAKK